MLILLFRGFQRLCSLGLAAKGGIFERLAAPMAGQCFVTFLFHAREYKLIGVQDWLTERDILLSSHLEHELTVDDLPDECQVFFSSLVHTYN